MRAVFDTNVLVSGLLFKGSMKDLFYFVRSGEVTLCLTQSILIEFQRVLMYPHLQAVLKRNGLKAEELIAFLRDRGEFFEDVSVHRLVKDDPTDDKFIDCAFIAGVRWLVSGDRHLLDLESVGSIRIVTPAAFLKEIL